MDSYPPRSARNGEIDTIVRFLASVIEPRGGVYLSAPLTSGMRFARSTDSAKIADTGAGTATDLIESNRLEASKLATQLRGHYPDPIIDPTAPLDEPGWEQNDYYVLWGRVITTYAHTVVYSNGWAYSRGCAYEYLVASRAHLACLDRELNPLPLPQAIKELEGALVAMTNTDPSHAFVSGVLKDLRALKQEEER